MKKLRETYLNGDEATKRFLEKKYGKRAIKQALEEIHSAEWLEKNAKQCPYCGTQIQVLDIFFGSYPKERWRDKVFAEMNLAVLFRHSLEILREVQF